MNKILIIYAHEHHDGSTINKAMVDAVRGMDGITFIDLYRLYPDFKIDSDAECARIFDHDVIIFQFPMHWFSTPALIKEYQDKVILSKHAYAPEGKAFIGKYFLCATSTGSGADKFGPGNRNNYTVDEFLRPVEQTMRASGMTVLPHYVIYGAKFAISEGRLEPHIKGWVTLLEKLRDGKIYIE
ncbi:MAG: NAD(P)H-dependent oxidoreductase [Alphaproteobacteria bacterium]|nr:NAD(P)H-dependent oxidoreductase [Alphaproteobacteria bacterium]HPF45341.1 NAD(P)H-dependent oxidoreductase [Emcibacteraceae bacterium]